MKFSRAFFRTTVVRISLIYVAVFALATMALFATVYLLTVSVIDAETDSVIQAELQGLSEQYSRLGITGLAAVIRDRSLGTAGTRSVYLLADANFQPIVGNLTSWPQVAQGAIRVGQWVEFDIQVRAADTIENHRVRAALITLQGGYRLLVGTDIVERERFERVMAHVGIWAVTLMILAGSVIGVIMNRRLLTQVNSIAAAGQQIAQGDFTRRLPVSGSGDELDELATGFNKLLTRIEQLTMALRFVIDGTAHDLRAPLNRLRARVEQVLAQTDTDRTQLEAVQRDTDALLHTLDSLLRIAQAQGGGVGAELVDLSLGALARELAELYAPLAEERGLRFRLDFIQPGHVHGSRQLLAHALANLLDNAIKYTPAGGEVSVSVTESIGVADLEVRDSGPGIPAAERQRVLKRFVRLEAAQGEHGSGLGLSLVAAVCRLHNADLILEDVAPSNEHARGLRVRLRFPLSSVLGLENKESR